MRILNVLPVVLFGAATGLAVPLVAGAQDMHNPNVSVLAPAPVDRGLLA